MFFQFENEAQFNNQLNIIKNTVPLTIKEKVRYDKDNFILDIPNWNSLKHLITIANGGKVLERAGYYIKDLQGNNTHVQSMKEGFLWSLFPFQKEYRKHDIYYIFSDETHIKDIISILFSHNIFSILRKTLENNKILLKVSNANLFSILTIRDKFNAEIFYKVKNNSFVKYGLKHPFSEYFNDKFPTFYSERSVFSIKEEPTIPSFKEVEWAFDVERKELDNTNREFSFNFDITVIPYRDYRKPVVSMWHYSNSEFKKLEAWAFSLPLSVRPNFIIRKTDDGFLVRVKGNILLDSVVLPYTDKKFYNLYNNDTILCNVNSTLFPKIPYNDFIKIFSVNPSTYFYIDTDEDKVIVKEVSVMTFESLERLSVYSLYERREIISSLYSKSVLSYSNYKVGYQELKEIKQECVPQVEEVLEEDLKEENYILEDKVEDVTETSYERKNSLENKIISDVTLLKDYQTTSDLCQEYMKLLLIEDQNSMFDLTLYFNRSKFNVIRKNLVLISRMDQFFCTTRIDFISLGYNLILYGDLFSEEEKTFYKLNWISNFENFINEVSIIKLRNFLFAYEEFVEKDEFLSIKLRDKSIARIMDNGFYSCHVFPSFISPNIIKDFNSKEDIYFKQESHKLSQKMSDNGMIVCSAIENLNFDKNSYDILVEENTKKVKGSDKNKIFMESILKFYKEYNHNPFEWSGVSESLIVDLKAKYSFDLSTQHHLKQFSSESLFLRSKKSLDDSVYNSNIDTMKMTSQEIQSRLEHHIGFFTKKGNTEKSFEYTILIHAFMAIKLAILCGEETVRKTLETLLNNINLIQSPDKYNKVLLKIIVVSNWYKFEDISKKTSEMLSETIIQAKITTSFISEIRSMRNVIPNISDAQIKKSFIDFISSKSSSEEEHLLIRSQLKLVLMFLYDREGTLGLDIKRNIIQLCETCFDNRLSPIERFTLYKSIMEDTLDMSEVIKREVAEFFIKEFNKISDHKTISKSFFNQSQVLFIEYLNLINNGVLSESLKFKNFIRFIESFWIEYF